MGDYKEAAEKSRRTIEEDLRAADSVLSDLLGPDVTGDHVVAVASMMRMDREILLCGPLSAAGGHQGEAPGEPGDA